MSPISARTPASHCEGIHYAAGFGRSQHRLELSARGAILPLREWSFCTERPIPQYLNVQITGPLAILSLERSNFKAVLQTRAE